MVFGWSPGIGDPTIWGWLTVINYLLACVASSRAARANCDNAIFWTFVSLAMFALCVNKQLDLQSLLTAIGREMAERGRWYNDRKIVQIYFFKAIFLIAITAMSLLIFINLKSGKSVIVATVGMLLITTFVLSRAASFHGMDNMLNTPILSLKMNHLLENFGIALVLGSASYAASASAKR